MNSIIAFSAELVCMGWALVQGIALCRIDLDRRIIPHRHVLGVLLALGACRFFAGNPYWFHGGAGFDVAGPVLVAGLVVLRCMGAPLGGGDIKFLGAGALAGGTWSLVCMELGGMVWAFGWLGAIRLQRPGMTWGALRRVRIPLAPGLCMGLFLFFGIALALPGQELPRSVDGERQSLPGDRPLRPGLAQAPLDEGLKKRLAGQKISALECPRQAVADLVRALGARGGIAMVCDETVSGEVAWYVPAGSLFDALEAFMVRQSLYARLEGGVLVLSRMAFESRGDRRFVLAAEGVSSGILLRTACRLADCTVLGVALPEKQMDIHGFEGGMEAFLALILPADGSIKVRSEGSVFTLEKESLPDPRQPGSESGRFKLGGTGDNWKLDVEKAGIEAVVKELGRQGGFECVFMQKSQQTLEDLHVGGMKSLALVDLLCALTGMDYTREEGGRLRFVEAVRKDLFRKSFELEVLGLRYMAVQDALQLLPPELAATAAYRVDKANNALILYGTGRERELLRGVFTALDRQPEGREWATFGLENLDVKDAVSRLPAEFPAGEALVLEAQNAFMMRLTPVLKTRLLAFLEELDRARPPQCIKLRYASPEDVLALMPAGFQKTDLSPGRNNTLYYSGPPGRFGELQAMVAAMDVPEPQIRYQVLVVEYQENESLTLRPDLGMRPVNAQTDKGTVLESLVVGLGESLGLSFDLVGGFGATFAASLDAKIARKKARIMTDTTIQGLSGQELKFQNTQTYRIAETETDPDTGEIRATGVTREITSGLFLGLKGAVSGDGMITMNVSATLSERGGDEADSSGTNPLSTSERIVNTRVRTPAGQPLVVGGLVKSHSARTTSGIPLLVDIPLVGDLLSANAPVREYSEVSVYILPFVEYGLLDQDLERLDAEEFQRRFGPLKGFTPEGGTE